MSSTARTAAPLLTLTALLLAGCSPAATLSASDIAQKCGGEQAGIIVSGDGLAYTLADDSTGEAYTCLIENLIAEESDQQSLTAAIEAGASTPQTVSYGDMAVAWNNTDGTDLWIAFDPQ